MNKQDKRPIVLDRFYQSLDEKTDNELTSEQRAAVEKAVLDITLASRHRFDIRKSFPFLNRRYYFVFLFGRDMRRHPRKESALFRIMMSVLLVLLFILSLSSVVVVIYLIKSALGIDIFPDFHLGLWDWLMHTKR